MVRVFLVDGGPDTVNGLETMLRTAGYRVVAEASGTQALQLIEQEVVSDKIRNDTSPAKLESGEHEAHAAARWARALIPILGAPKDPRTLAGWSRLANASRGALRTWCVTVGISPRRSLVFARLLRAVLLGRGGRSRPENLLDVVDRRTLAGLLKLAGLNADAFPRNADEFLSRQTLIRDAEALAEVARAVASLERRKQGQQLLRG